MALESRNDLELYERHAEQWWDANAPSFRSLHRVQRYRLQLLTAHWGNELRGATVVDLGCGGGLMSESLSRMGAQVTGVDRSSASLRVALEHARAAGLKRCRYARGDLLAVPLASATAQLVLLSDVVEHVRDVARVIAEAARLLVPGGKLFVHTLNRTFAARLLAVTLGEGLGLIPRGTHDPRLFVTPQELTGYARTNGLRLLGVQGEFPRLWRTLRSWAVELRPSRGISVGYSAFFCKETAA